MAQKPLFPLTTVKELVDKCYFSAPTKSSHAVITVKRHNGIKWQQHEAEHWIREQLKALCDDDFYKRTPQWAIEFADVYGKEIDGESWFIKFLIKDGELESISFHPAEEEMILQTGMKIKAGNFIYEKESKVWRVR